MAKFDGMDPKLVRELLAEVRHAAVQMRQIEGRISQLTGGAGLAVQAGQRPGQVADSCDEMVRDVTTRLELLEKREDSGNSTPVSGGESTTPADDKPEASKPADDGKPEASKPADDGKPEASKPAEDKPDESKPEASKPAEDKPDATKPAEDKPDATKPADDGKPVQEKPDATPGPDTAKDGADTQVADPPATRDDTPAKDHPDDLAIGKPQVVEIDGVKVLQVPVDQPTAKEIEDLLAKMDQVQPVDMPGQEQGPQVQPADDGDVKKWAADGSDVVSVEANRLTPAELKELIEKSSEIPPMEMPSVEVPKGEWGKGDWAPENIKPDGPPGSVDPGGPATQSTTAGGDTPQTTPTTGDAAQGTPIAAQGTPVPAQGTPVGSQGTPQLDGSPGQAEPAVAGSPVQVLPIATGGDPALLGPLAGGSNGDVQQWANDGSDVVSVEADRLTPAELKELIEKSSEIPPMEMPSVEVPKGEWGKGEWVPEDIKPDGPPGSVDPGAPA
ncbi:hypothetical protein [Nonomuraea soli]|uniref:Uncharacterized protein n=1 Tax=Nonomuraea soli TaxID=1032476 RepID=A0A7W0CL89_9ACTN|nr:hypothetical protein [Nonomuraea soli]MBA2893042.1 hypothetical protein [Nonomuraea soli]